MRASAVVWGRLLCSVEWLNMSERGFVNLLKNVLKKSVEKPSGPGVLPPGSLASDASCLVILNSKFVLVTSENRGMSKPSNDSQMIGGEADSLFISRN